MSDFLDRAVSRGLGIARVVQRRREPLFAEPTAARPIDRDGLPETADMEDEAPASRKPSLPESLGRRASGELRPNEGIDPERSPVAASGESVLEVEPSAKSRIAIGSERSTGSGSLPTEEVPEPDGSRARSSDATSARIVSSALRRRNDAESTIGERDSEDDGRFDVRGSVPRESVESGSLDVGRDVKRGGREAANGEVSWGAARDAEADVCEDGSIEADSGREPDLRSRDADADLAFARRRRDRADQAFDTALGTRNVAPNARRVEDELTINVSIGSIEIARPQPPPRAAAPMSPEPRRPSLDDYLQLRDKIRSR